MTGSKLRQTVRGFLRKQPEVVGFITALEKKGPVAIFGGLLRDAAVFGLEGFDSDIDLVVECPDDSLWHSVMDGHDHVKNRLGGYRLLVGGQSLDVWALGTTWAIRRGLVAGSALDILPETTFFSCNAVAFDLTRDVLYTKPLFWRWVTERFVDINLAPNPDSFGTTIRALRFLVTVPGIQLGPHLSEFLRQALRDTEASSLCQREASSYSSPVLDPSRISAVIKRFWPDGLDLPG